MGAAMIARCGVGALAGAVLLLLPPAASGGQSSPAAPEFARGQIVDSVICADDETQSYALYLPSDYTPARPWNLLLAFHPSARGRVFAETYQAAAERFGYIVAASNNSRNGSWEATTRAVRAMSRDVGRRFQVDAQRVYLTGHSGGARVALEVALGPNEIAGVIASSAGFPDAKPRRSVKFPIFATAGIDDFNYLEMRRLDAELTSPHYLAVFDGGHTLPPASVAAEALEWLELQAIRSGRRAQDRRLIDALFASRLQRIEREKAEVEKLRLVQASAADFARLHDVAALEARAETIARDPAVKRAQNHDRAALAAETRLLHEALDTESRLRDPDVRSASLARLQGMLEAWSRVAAAATASSERSQARRLLGALAAGAAARTSDEDYLRLLRQYRREPDEGAP
jgi:poly(3-hydroxybutyrate) depolymerase